MVHRVVHIVNATIRIRDWSLVKHLFFRLIESAFIKSMTTDLPMWLLLLLLIVDITIVEYE